MLLLLRGGLIGQHIPMRELDGAYQALNCGVANQRCLRQIDFAFVRARGADERKALAHAPRCKQISVPIPPV